MRHLTLEAYQWKARKTAVFPPEQAIPYLALGLNGEAGEVAEILKKVIRGKRDLPSQRDALISELGDVLWYVALLADQLGVNLTDVAARNLEKLEARQVEGRLADKRDPDPVPSGRLGALTGEDPW